MSGPSIRSLVFIALFAALFVFMSTISFKLGASAVPITLQTLSVGLAGLFLPPRHAFASIFIVILLTLIGLPLIGGGAGFVHLTGPTGGYIIAFPFCALAVSLAVNFYLRSAGENIKRNKILSLIVFFIIFELFSSLLAYVTGVPWLMHSYDMTLSKGLTAGFYPFIPGDALKSFAGAVIAVSLTPYIVHLRSSMHLRQSSGQEQPANL
jgi:biotin transport system substrate-specific component